VQAKNKLAGEDDRPPICPACGVTMGMIADDNGGVIRYVCLECGFSDEASAAS
jgi:hypothetical protein